MRYLDITENKLRGKLWTLDVMIGIYPRRPVAEIYACRPI